VIADVFITIKNRGTLSKRSLDSFIKNTNPDHYRLTIVRDGNFLNTEYVLRDPHIVKATYQVITNTENEGLGPSINKALCAIDATNKWYEDKMATELNSVAPFICYCQDDLLYTPDWLPTLAKFFNLFEQQYKLGFASGVECIEHAVRQKLPNGMLLKNWIRAAQMFARREYWMSMWPIPRFDPETGRVRAKPNDGVGSGVDWHFIRNHVNSVDKSGKTCLVLPGLVKHMGYKDSTWLKRELPESEADKAAIAASEN
jgi:hypothetical protein